MIHKFIENSIITANDEGMYKFNPNSYDRRFKVTFAMNYNHSAYVELEHCETGEIFTYEGCAHNLFDSITYTPNINHEIEELLTKYKFKSFSAVDVQGKIFQIDIP